MLLWVTSERGRAEPELQAAQQLAERGIEVWSLDPVSAYFLPQLPSSMDAVPAQDLADWLRAAQAGGKRVRGVRGVACRGAGAACRRFAASRSSGNSFACC